MADRRALLHRSGPGRARRRARRRLDEIFATRDLASWAEVFAGEPDFFWAPVNTVDDLLTDAQFVAAGGIVEVPDGVATTPMVAMPADFRGTPGGPRWVAPRLGEHTAEVLRELENDDPSLSTTPPGL